MTSFFVLLALLILTLGIGWVGGMMTRKEIPTWYAGLRKPAFNPPNWIFAPVWTTLYILMAVAAWTVWRSVDFGWGWFSVFAIQLALNLGWSYLFFAKHQIGLAFLEVLVLWITIAVNIAVFWSIQPWAGILLLPYIAWVTFASILNGSILMLNRRSA